MEVLVRPGDSFWYYSQVFSMPLPLIEDSNPDIDPLRLIAGTPVQIPGYITETYVVQPNDSFWSIANRYQSTVEQVQLLNPNILPNQLQIGQTITVPIRVCQFVVDDPGQYTYEKMQQDLNQLLTIYPFLRREQIGQSVLGKDIDEIQIGRGQKTVHVNGSFHANEWITTPVLMRFINEYALSLTNGRPVRGLFLLPFYQTVNLSVVPMVNPDGVNLVIQGADAAGDRKEEVLAINSQQADFSQWKANIRGVDLNNQYPALWEVEAERKPTSPAPRDFPGTSPLTEPEAIAMADLAKTRNFARMSALHTQGKVIYWGFQNLEPPEAEQLANEFSRVSGFTPIRFIDSYAGYKDWFIQEFRRPGFTIELGLGTNPLPVEQFPEMYEETLGILLANLYMP